MLSRFHFTCQVSLISIGCQEHCTEKDSKAKSTQWECHDQLVMSAMGAAGDGEDGNSIHTVDFLILVLQYMLNLFSWGTGSGSSCCPGLLVFSFSSLSQILVKFSKHLRGNVKSQQNSKTSRIMSLPICSVFVRQEGWNRKFALLGIASWFDFFAIVLN